MDWWKPLTALAVGLLAFVVVGGLVRLLRAASTSAATLAVVALLVVVVIAWHRAGTAPNRWLSTPYWGR